jgi:hypothetical protein
MSDDERPILHPHTSPADRAAVDAPTGPIWVDAPMAESWHRDAVAGLIAQHRDLKDWGMRVAETYGRSGTLEVTAVVWALMDAVAGVLAQQDEARARLSLVRDRADQWDDMARDHDEQGATTTALVYRAHAKLLRRALDGNL